MIVIDAIFTFIFSVFDIYLILRDFTNIKNFEILNPITSNIIIISNIFCIYMIIYLIYIIFIKKKDTTKKNKKENKKLTPDQIIKIANVCLLILMFIIAFLGDDSWSVY